MAIRHLSFCLRILFLLTVEAVSDGKNFGEVIEAYGAVGPGVFPFEFEVETTTTTTTTTPPPFGKSFFNLGKTPRAEQFDKQNVKFGI